MADNSTLPSTDTIRDIDKGGVKTQVMVLDIGGSGTEKLASAANPIPVLEIETDCTIVLSTTITSVGTSASIDTLGYGAIIVQISGPWVGSCYFEASNDGVTWDTILVFSRDNLSLQDIITQGGLFTVRPSGRYVHLVTTNITGSMVINAIGRSAEGISAADLLSLAMDRANNTPMHVSLDDLSFTKLAPVQPMTQLAFYSVTGVIPINTQIFTVDCSNVRGLSLQYTVGTTGVITAQWSDDGTDWTTATLYDQAGNAGTTLGAGSGLRVVNVLAKYFRLYMSTATTALTTKAVLLGSPNVFANAPTTQAVTVSSGTVTTVSTVTSVSAATISNITAATAVNGATPGTLVSAASNNLTQIKATAGRVYFLDATNTTATVQYIKLFNAPSASVTMGTTSATFNFAVPPTASGGRLSVPINDLGLCVNGTGISFAITTGSSLTDNTATTAGAVILNYAYA